VITGKAWGKRYFAPLSDCLFTFFQLHWQVVAYWRYRGYLWTPVAQSQLLPRCERKAWFPTCQSYRCLLNLLSITTRQFKGWKVSTLLPVGWSLHASYLSTD